MPIKQAGDDGTKHGLHNYKGKWRRHRKGKKGYKGSVAIERLKSGAKPVFLRIAVRNITDYFGWENVAASLNIALTKVKELRLYNLKPNDPALVTRLHLLNAEYIRNKYAVPVPPIYNGVEFHKGGYRWMTGPLIAIMRRHLNEGCFQGMKAYKDGTFSTPSQYRGLVRKRARIAEARKENVLKLLSRRRAQVRSSQQGEQG
jgi:hypothetical protein